MNESFEIMEVKQISDDLVPAFKRLIPQLSKSSIPPDESELTEIISSNSTILFIARTISNNNEIIGCLTLIIYQIPTGKRAYIEDVVVDSQFRRQGIATALTQIALNRAIKAGAITVDLTSRPYRVEANALYKKLGFVQRETNVYRYVLK